MNIIEIVSPVPIITETKIKKYSNKTYNYIRRMEHFTNNYFYVFHTIALIINIYSF